MKTKSKVKVVVNDDSRSVFDGTPNDELEKMILFDPGVTWLKDSMRQSFREGDGEGLAYGAHPNGLSFVSDNAYCLSSRGIYESALMTAYTSTRHNLCNWSLPELDSVFGRADRRKLQALGAPLPENDPIKVYRGVAGVGRARHVRGFSWTLDLDVACWFALRYGDLADPAAYEAELSHDEVYCFCTDRDEQEVIALPRRCRRVNLNQKEMTERHARVVKRMNADEQQRLAQMPKYGEVE